MAFVGYASIFCIMGVWGGVYLHEVHGLDLVERGYALLAMAIAFALGLFFFGWLARRLGSMNRAVVVGAVLAIAPFAVLAGWPRPPAPPAPPLFTVICLPRVFCGRSPPTAAPST